MKIVFMGTPDFAVPTLKNLVDSKHEVVGVVTQPDRPKGRGRELAPPPVKQLALQENLTLFQPENASDPSFVETLRKLTPDLIIVVAYGQILKPPVLEIPRMFCINLHASILPKYRGAAPINWAIINGETETGVTTMKMDQGLDTGDILLIRKIEIKPDDDSQTLENSLAEIGASLVLETIDRLKENTILPIPQDSSQSTYAPKMKKEHGLIQWEKEAAQIANLVRGVVPWPGAYSFLKSKRLRIRRVETTPSESGEQPGTILRLTDRGIEVGTTRGRIIITELQPEGKNKMSAKSFLLGHHVDKGDRFTSTLTLEPSNAS
ncbi:MAG: methionyl-tRNA formyltransferase [Nitrospinales bacterium]